MLAAMLTAFLTMTFAVGLGWLTCQVVRLAVGRGRGE